MNKKIILLKFKHKISLKPAHVLEFLNWNTNNKNAFTSK